MQLSTYPATHPSTPKLLMADWMNLLMLDGGVCWSHDQSSAVVSFVSICVAFSVDFGLRDDHVRSGRRLRCALAGACSKLIGNGFVMHGAVMQVREEM